MGRIVTLLILIQISLPGFCCITNRFASSAALLFGVSSAANERQAESCCGIRCCTPSYTKSETKSQSSRKAASCCVSKSTPSESTPHQDEPAPTEEPCHHGLCSCLDWDPMIPPAESSIDLELEAASLGPVVWFLASPADTAIRAYRYRPPPLRRHLLLCVIRC
jgi:hypothetical protein